MQPQALGAQIFTILGEGQPPTSVPPGSPGTPGPGAQDPGGPGTPPSAAPAPLRPAQPAIPVAADPTYTG
jgi:hypothetical protein